MGAVFPMRNNNCFNKLPKVIIIEIMGIMGVKGSKIVTPIKWGISFEESA